MSLNLNIYPSTSTKVSPFKTGRGLSYPVCHAVYVSRSIYEHFHGYSVHADSRFEWDEDQLYLLIDQFFFFFNLFFNLSIRKEKSFSLNLSYLKQRFSPYNAQFPHDIKSKLEGDKRDFLCAHFGIHKWLCFHVSSWS